MRAARLEEVGCVIRRRSIKSILVDVQYLIVIPLILLEFRESKGELFGHDFVAKNLDCSLDDLASYHLGGIQFLKLGAAHQIFTLYQDQMLLTCISS